MIMLMMLIDNSKTAPEKGKPTTSILSSSAPAEGLSFELVFEYACVTS